MTARAADKLKEIVEKQGRPDLALRVYVTPGGCSGFSYGMTFAESIEEGDAVVDTDGVKIVVDPMSAMYVKGSEIDFVDALMGAGFAINNPNVQAACGCGSSFQAKDEADGEPAAAHAGGGCGSGCSH
jgi:iron-sulfur cluster assembly protein